MMTAIDLNDITNCPIGFECASCLSQFGLDVAVLETPVGVFCVTLCASCEEAGRLPHLGWASAVDRSLTHCTHLGITADQMAIAMDQEAGR